MSRPLLPAYRLGAQAEAAMEPSAVPASRSAADDKRYKSPTSLTRQSRTRRAVLVVVLLIASILLLLVVVVLVVVVLLPSIPCCRCWPIDPVQPHTTTTMLVDSLSLLPAGLASALVSLILVAGQPAAAKLQLQQATSSTSSTSSSAFTLLYAASYSGAISTLNLTVALGGCSTSAAAAGEDDLLAASLGASLAVVATNDGCAGSPAWLTLDHPGSVLYCADEGLTSARGSISSFRTSGDGVLERLDRLDVLQGPVSAVIYAEGRGLAVAHYAGSTLSSYDISNPSDLSPVRADRFELAGPGPVPSRQDAPHPHQAVLDPTGRFILVPDLGADLVRLFAISDAAAADDQGGLDWSILEPLAVEPGSGPRHVAFLDTGDKTFLYLVAELTNTVTGYEVLYGDDGESLSFQEVYSSSTHGLDRLPPTGAAAAEIQVSPDGNFVLVSSRNENAFNITLPTGEEVSSDTIISFAVDRDTGALSLAQEFPAGGRFPRHFSLNKAGDLVAVGLQIDSRVVVIERDALTGEMREIIASVDVEAQVTTIIFDE